MNNIEKIRQEIERLYDGEAPKHDQQCDFDDGYFTGIDAISKFIDSLSDENLPDNLDEAANNFAVFYDQGTCDGIAQDCFKAGVEWMAGQGWIDDGSMPPETKQESNTLQGHREWTESEQVLVWDSMYGCHVDWTRNGKWMSEQIGGYTGQVCHGIIAWRPIPEYKGKQ